MKSALMLGVNPNAEREKNDFYATYPHAVEIALDIFKQIGLHNTMCGNVLVAKVIFQRP